MRKKVITDTYGELDEQVNEGKQFLFKFDYADEYSISDVSKLMTQIGSDLPIDINIFSDLPEDVFNLPEVGELLSALKDAVKSLRSEAVTLSKLRVGEYTKDEIVLDWIFNYFRIYFSFDFNGDDCVGMIANNPIENSFSSVCKTIKQDQYEAVAAEVIDFVIDKLNA